MFYIAQHTVRWTAQTQSALYFTPWQNRSFRHQLDFSGKHSSRAANTRENYSLTFPPLSIARYSFIRLSELGCSGENENVQAYSMSFETCLHIAFIISAFFLIQLIFLVTFSPYTLLSEKINQFASTVNSAHFLCLIIDTKNTSLWRTL